jgi:hypothetical protein
LAGSQQWWQLVADIQAGGIPEPKFSSQIITQQAEWHARTNPGKPNYIHETSIKPKLQKHTTEAYLDALKQCCRSVVDLVKQGLTLSRILQGLGDSRTGLSHVCDTRISLQELAGPCRNLHELA